jgi:hypothetical protein
MFANKRRFERRLSAYKWKKQLGRALWTRSVSQAFDAQNKGFVPAPEQICLEVNFSVQARGEWIF